MKVLHVAPGDSAGGSLIQALRLAGEDGENVLSCMDDFSCGPISSLTPASRAQWWGRFSPWYTAPEVEHRLAEFWNRLDAWDGKIVLWFGRRSAQELSFLHAMADRLEGRRISLVDVTGFQYPFTRRDGTPAISEPMPAVSLVRHEALLTLLGTEREATDKELSRLRSHWCALVREDAPFRVATDEGLVSAPADYFDQVLLELASTAWLRVNRLIGEALGHEKAEMQVGDVLLASRIVALVEQGRLLANVDPWQIRAGEVRLPDALPTGRSAAFRDQ